MIRRIVTIIVDRDDNGWDTAYIRGKCGDQIIGAQEIFHAACPINEFTQRIQSLLEKYHEAWHQYALFGTTSRFAPPVEQPKETP